MPVRVVGASCQLAASMLRILSVVCLTLLLFACNSEKQVYQAIESGSTVLAFGDSITYGTGANRGQGYPEKLAVALDWQVVNAGIPGEQAFEGRARITPSLAEHQPALVIIELGGNDFLRKRPAEKVKEDLRHIVNAVRQSGAVPVLVAVPRLSIARASMGILEDSPIYAELAEEEAVLLFADQLSAILSDRDLVADRIHPNATGYALMASELAAFMRTHGLAY